MLSLPLSRIPTAHSGAITKPTTHLPGLSICWTRILRDIVARRLQSPVQVGYRPSPAEQPPLPPELNPPVLIPTPPLGLPKELKIPAGSFLMGSPDSDQQTNSDEKPQHEVAVATFFMGRFLVTRRLYRDILGDSPAEWRSQDSELSPVNWVSWFDTLRFCNALSERQGLQTCYRIAGNQVSWERHCNGYRLPTEAEWEYAVRAGEKAAWFLGDDPDELERFAWFAENAGGQVHPVGQKDPINGLYDLLGNVAEWCWDWHGGYTPGVTRNPSGPVNGVRRIVRGGDFESSPWELRSAARNKLKPATRHVRIGFRYVRTGV